jgi:osmotically inducible protein OsmC
MAVSMLLGQAGFKAAALDTIATITMEGMEITSSHLAIKGSIPKITTDKFQEIVKTAEVNCLISKALKIAISSEASLV